jgi:hypothetical protein
MNKELDTRVRVLNGTAQNVTRMRTVKQCSLSVHIVAALLKALSYGARKNPLLGKHVQANTRQTIQEQCFLCGSGRDRCKAAASAPMDWLGSDHVGTSTDTHATIEELCFLCMVRAATV